VELIDAWSLCCRVVLCCVDQMSLILSDDGPVVGGYELPVFVRRAGLMVSSLFDRASVVERSTLSERGVVAPIALLTSEDRERVEAELRQRFAEFDTNNDGALDDTEFASCLSDTSLCLSSTQIEQLRKEIDTNNTGQVHIQQFMHFAYGQLEPHNPHPSIIDQWLVPLCTSSD
jgi:hypothetical protein